MTVTEDIADVVLAERREGLLVRLRRGRQHALDVVEMTFQILADIRFRQSFRNGLSVGAGRLERNQHVARLIQQDGAITDAEGALRFEDGDDLAADRLHLERITTDVPDDRQTIGIGDLLRAIDAIQEIQAARLESAHANELPAQIPVHGKVVLEVRSQHIVCRRAAVLGLGSGVRKQFDVDCLKPPLPAAVRIRFQHGQDHLFPRRRFVPGFAERAAETDLLARPRDAVDTDEDIALLQTRAVPGGPRRDPRQQHAMCGFISRILGELDRVAGNAQEDLSRVRLRLPGEALSRHDK